MKTTVVVWTVVAMLALACGNFEKTKGFSADSASQAEAAPAALAQRRDILAGKTSAAFANVSSSSDEVSAFDSLPFETITPTMLIRTAQASVEVAVLDTGVSGVRAVAQRVGGYVANVSVQDGRDEPHSATLEVRMPASRFDEALAALHPLGKVESVSVSTADVGEEYVDVNARMDNARKLERRLIGLLATRTGKLKDVLDVERELSRVREEIERYEGRLRYLRTRAAVSTISVTVHEPVPVVGERGSTSVLAEAFRQAWRNFVSFIAQGIAAMGVLVPLAVIAAGLLLVARRFVTKPRPPATPASA
ncbi:MAG TPA: DUF4349 domain-containing protein [Gemmatimonadaceae bacterium]|nr:DUF4349 domain-containing protein [Gemmatimonadaceae bacterium]